MSGAGVGCWLGQLPFFDNTEHGLVRDDKGVVETADFSTQELKQDTIRLSQCGAHLGPLEDECPFWKREPGNRFFPSLDPTCILRSVLTVL